MNEIVSVICLCYNQQLFLREAIDSVINQTYANIEIILVDDKSIDESREIIEDYQKRFPHIKVLLNDLNLGNCKSFNKALAMATGKYIIDFACDDVMRHDKIERQLEAFGNLDESYAVVFTDADNIDINSNFIENHLKKIFKKNTLYPSGQIYKDLVERYFISTPTMMIRKKVLEELGGYDETLTYEDFDFWIRSSRKYKYHFMNTVSMDKRIVPDSLSAKFTGRKSYDMLYSTYRVCEKIFWLNRNTKEDSALKERIKYECKVCFLTGNISLVKKYFKIFYNLYMVSSARSSK